MTSELKPLDIWDDATNAVCQSMQENKMCNCPDGDCLAAKIEPPEETVRHWNTRAVPDVPELVTLATVDQSGHMLDVTWVDCVKALKYTHGLQLIAKDQAAAMLAAKDKEVQALKEKLGVVSTERHADAEYIGHLQAELDQIKAQEPVGWQWQTSAGEWVTCNKDAAAYKSKREDQPTRPLYAAPVDQTAEIERLREVISMTRNHISGEVFVGDKRLLDLVDTALSGKEPL